MRTREELAAEIEARRRCFAWLDGWRWGARVKDDDTPDHGKDPDFLVGYEAGKLAMQAAKKQAEELTGYTLMVFRPA